ncbi:MAG: hypothetical protein HY821_12780 [Acidobacteria bacterium]|nr:hypothetical protein [Acidobacteriota bacterium]
MGCKPLLALLLSLAALAQTGRPPYDPNDPEGLVLWPNGQGRFAWKRAGHWKIERFPAAPDRQPAAATLDALSALLRATPEGSQPVGWWMLESRRLEAQDPALGRAPWRFSSGFYPFYIEDILRNGKFVQATGGETESVYFEFNLLPGRIGRPVIATESGGVEFYLRPRATATFAGFPLIEGQDLLIARSGRDPWSPVSYGRALKAALPQYEKDAATAAQRLAGLKKENEETQSAAFEQKMRDQFERNYGALRTSNPNRYQTRLATLEKEIVYYRQLGELRANPQRDKDGNWYWNPVDALEDARRRLASLSPQDAARPACFTPAQGRDGRYAMPGAIQISGAPNCEDLAADNLGYFDPALGRASAQLLLVRSIGRCATVAGGRLVGNQYPPRSSPPQGCLRHVPIWEAMDWQRVGALVVH